MFMNMSFNMLSDFEVFYKKKVNSLKITSSKTTLFIAFHIRCGPYYIGIYLHMINNDYYSEI